MFRKRMQVIVLMSAVSVAACEAGGGAPAMETAADSAAIAALADKYEAAWNAADAAALSMIVHENFNSAEPDGVVIDGRAAFEAAMKTELDARKAMPPAPTPVVMELTRVKTVFLSATVATSTGTFAVKGLPAGGGPDKGSYLVVSVKGADGQWLIRNALGAAMIPPPPPPK